jgi:hypothetical protein
VLNVSASVIISICTIRAGKKEQRSYLSDPSRPKTNKIKIFKIIKIYKQQKVEFILDLNEALLKVSGNSAEESGCRP